MDGRKIRVFQYSSNEPFIELLLIVDAVELSKANKQSAVLFRWQ